MMPKIHPFHNHGVSLSVSIEPSVKTYVTMAAICRIYTGLCPSGKAFLSGLNAMRMIGQSIVLKRLSR